MTTITLTQDIVTDTLIEDETGRIWLITRTRLFDDDGNLRGEEEHRAPIEPVESLDDEDRARLGKAPVSDEVKALAPIARTPERLARYRDQQERAEQERAEQATRTR